MNRNDVMVLAGQKTLLTFMRSMIQSPSLRGPSLLDSSDTTTLHKHVKKPAYIITLSIRHDV